MSRPAAALPILALSLLIGGAVEARADSPDGGLAAPPEARALRNPFSPTSLSAWRGALLYRQHCAVCHGDRGRGDGPATRDITIKPADLADGARMSRRSDGEIFLTI